MWVRVQVYVTQIVANLQVTNCIHLKFGIRKIYVRINLESFVFVTDEKKLHIFSRGRLHNYIVFKIWLYFVFNYNYKLLTMYIFLYISALTYLEKENKNQLLFYIKVFFFQLNIQYRFILLNISRKKQQLNKRKR